MKEKIENFKKMYEYDKASFKKNWEIFKGQAKENWEEAKNPKTFKKQIPNLLTASRLTAPFFIVPAALSGNIGLTALFTCLFAGTDALDGYIARKTGTTSEFGRELDAATDKLFAGSLLLPLIIVNPLLITNFLAEFGIGAINMHSRLNGNRPKTSKVGKVKTALLSLTMVLNYLAMVIPFINPSMFNKLALVTLFTQGIAALNYYKMYKKDEEAKGNVTNKENVKLNINYSKKKTLSKDKVLVKDKNVSPITNKEVKLKQSKPKENKYQEQIDELNRFKEELIKEQKKVEKQIKQKQIVRK